MVTEDSKKYVSEIVWLPTYIVIAIVGLVAFRNPAVSTITIFFSIILVRILLELVYRVIFGPKRLNIRNGIIAFICQILVFGGLVLWLQQHETI